MHVFKLGQDYADLFIYDLDLPNRRITYEVRDKEDGRLMEPRETVVVQFTTTGILFDNRFIGRDLAAYIIAILNDLINVKTESNIETQQLRS